MAKRLGVVLAAVALVAAGCGGDDDAQPGGADIRSPKTVEVRVDAKSPAFNGAFLAYFPRDVTVHPGDTVDFSSTFNGEPHSVTFGTLVDVGVARALADPDAEEEPEELAKIPSMLREDLSAVPAAAEPCFIRDVDPPTDRCTPEQKQQPEFDGTYSYFNSGFLPQGAQFTVKLADDVRPGTYTFFCTLHRARMAGSIKVVDEGQPVPSAQELRAAGDRQLQGDFVDRLEPLVDDLRKGTLPPFVPTARPGGAIAGGGSEEVKQATINEFGPTEVSIKTGEAVTWTVVGPHTITFGVTDAPGTFISTAPDGTVTVDQPSLASAGGPGQPQGPEGEARRGVEQDSGRPPPPTVIDAGSWDGSGRRSSGALFSVAGQGLLAYKLTFTVAGTYPYFCTLHPGMTGTVKVE